MDLKRIRHAVALAEEMNFIRAAEKVHLSQPAFSRSIQALESELGMTLFDRSKQGLTITVVGAQFLSRAKLLADEADNLERDMALKRRGEIGHVSFGAGPLPAASLMPQLLQRARQGRPGFRASLMVNNWHHLLTHLLNKEIEFFIGDTQNIPSGGEVSITPLMQQQGPFVCRAGHPLLGLEKRYMRDLLPYGFASLRLPKDTDLVLRNAMGIQLNHEMPVVIECDDLGVLTEVVSHENLILIVSHHAVAASLSSGKLCTLEVEDPPTLLAKIGLVQLRQRTLSPAAELLIATLHELLDETEKAGVAQSKNPAN